MSTPGMIMKINLFRFASILLLTCPAIAMQAPVGFNIALQDSSQVQVPSSMYSAASFQTGTWNRVVSPSATLLTDVNGNSTTAMIRNVSEAYGSYGHDDLPGTSGDDELLYDSGFEISDPGTTFTFIDLPPGDYVMYSYFTSPGSTFGGTMTLQGGHASFPTNVSDFDGNFIEGMSHFIHNFSVLPGQYIDIRIILHFGGDPVRIHGFQVVPVDALHKVQFCDSQNNSTGSMANMVLSGSSSVSSNNLQLGARDLPANQFGYFIVSTDPGTGTTPPSSQGNLCIGGSVGRHNRIGEVLFSGAAGAVLMDVDLTNIPQPTGPVSVMPGESWHWQYWYRDNNPSNTSNFSDAYRVGFVD